MEQVLTADLGGLSEGLCHFRIHGYHELLVLGDCSIAFLYPVANPPREHTFEEGGCHVADPLLAYFVNLLTVGHVVPDVLMPIIEELCNVFQ